MSNDTLGNQSNNAAATHELARVSRVVKTLCTGNRVVLRAGVEEDLLTDMFNVIVDSGYRFAGVVMAVFDERKSLHWAAMAGDVIGEHSLAQYTWADDEGGAARSVPQSGPWRSWFGAMCTAVWCMTAPSCGDYLIKLLKSDFLPSLHFPCFRRVQCLVH